MHFIFWHVYSIGVKFIMRTVHSYILLYVPCILHKIRTDFGHLSKTGRRAAKFSIKNHVQKTFAILEYFNSHIRSILCLTSVFIYRPKRSIILNNIPLKIYNFEAMTPSFPNDYVNNCIFLPGQHRRSYAGLDQNFYCTTFELIQWKSCLIADSNRNPAVNRQMQRRSKTFGWGKAHMGHEKNFWTSLEGIKIFSPISVNWQFAELENTLNI